jgi:hypothetical protein
MACIPIGYTISGVSRKGTARVVTTCHYPPPKDTEPGTLFISRDSNVPFRKIDVVMSGRPFEQALKNIVNCEIEVFTTAGLSSFNWKLLWIYLIIQHFIDDPIADMIPSRPIHQNRLSEIPIQIIKRLARRPYHHPRQVQPKRRRTNPPHPHH